MKRGSTEIPSQEGKKALRRRVRCLRRSWGFASDDVSSKKIKLFKSINAFQEKYLKTSIYV